MTEDRGVRGAAFLGWTGNRSVGMHAREGKRVDRKVGKQACPYLDSANADSGLVKHSCSLRFCVIRAQVEVLATAVDRGLPTLQAAQAMCERV